MAKIIKRKSDVPFASDPAEQAYQAAKKAGAKITRDQIRPALQAFQSGLEASKKAYDEWAAKRAKDKAQKVAASCDQPMRM